MAVPNTNTFTLQDVTAEVGGTSLVQAFANSNDAYFDPLYKGSKDRLSNFRNYPVNTGISYISHQNDITIGNLTYNVNIPSDCTLMLLSIKATNGSSLVPSNIPTIGGVQATLCGAIDWVQIWRLANPATGNIQVVLTIPSGTLYCVTSLFYKAPSPIIFTGSINTGGTSSIISVAVQLTQNTNYLIIDGLTIREYPGQTASIISQSDQSRAQGYIAGGAGYSTQEKLFNSAGLTSYNWQYTLGSNLMPWQILIAKFEL